MCGGRGNTEEVGGLWCVSVVVVVVELSFFILDTAWFAVSDRQIIYPKIIPGFFFPPPCSNRLESWLVYLRQNV